MKTTEEYHKSFYEILSRIDKINQEIDDKGIDSTKAFIHYTIKDTIKYCAKWIFGVTAFYFWLEFLVVCLKG